MNHSPPNPVAAAAESSMAKKARESLQVFAEGGLSFFAFLLSIFIYVSFFNLSPSTDLFNNTKFWFCISNTLILIIAADYGAFSPSKQKLDHVRRHDHEQYYSRINTAEKITSIPKQEKGVGIVQERANPEEKLQAIIEERASSVDKPSHEDRYHGEKDGDCDRAKIPAKTYRRSKSEKAERVAAVVDGESKVTMRRSKTVKHEATRESAEEINNVFAEMTDEELNKRVEEFIQRFNRQIRLQDTGHEDEV